jgi:RimJ/RimL family protein N-acetyltransferase
MPPPSLRTDRLVLHAPSPPDLEDMAAMWGDPGVYEMIGGRAFTREEVWQRLLRYIGHWQVCGYGTLIVREPGGAFVGSVGLMDSRRDTDPSFEGRPEVGWALSPAMHGRGYALEALQAVLGWADGQGLASTVCIIDAANARSIRLAERVGFTPSAPVIYRAKPILLFERSIS